MNTQFLRLSFLFWVFFLWAEPSKTFASSPHTPSKKADILKLNCKPGRHLNSSVFYPYPVCSGEEGAALQLGPKEAGFLMAALELTAQPEEGAGAWQVVRDEMAKFVTTYAGPSGFSYKTAHITSYLGWQVTSRQGIFHALNSLDHILFQEFVLPGYNTDKVPISWVQCGERPTWSLVDDPNALMTCSLVVRSHRGSQMQAGISTSPTQVRAVLPREMSALWYNVLNTCSELVVKEMPVPTHRRFFLSGQNRETHPSVVVDARAVSSPCRKDPQDQTLSLVVAGTQVISCHKGGSCIIYLDR